MGCIFCLRKPLPFRFGGFRTDPVLRVARRERLATKDGTDPATLAYESLQGGYSGPNHPGMSLSQASCTISGNPATGPAFADCSMTVQCV